MTTLQPKTPAAVERIIRTALEKDPNKRWQDAGDLARELSWVATGSHTTTTSAAVPTPAAVWRPWMFAAAALVVAAIGAVGVNWRAAASLIRNPQSAIRNLVILPCRANDDATAQAYCDGLTDTLSAKMTPFAIARGLQVTSTLEVRGRGVHDAAQARREFGATLILEGGILRAADTLRVNYVLVDATTLKQLGAFSVTSPVGDPFALQDNVSTWAASVLALNLQTAEQQTLTTSGTRVPEAFALYLEGRGYTLDFQKLGNIAAAIDRFTRAPALDPRYASAHAGLGGALWLQYEATLDPALVPRARDACAQALALEPVAADAHVCLGTVQVGTGQYEAAAASFQRGLERDPLSDEAWIGLARAQAALGRTLDAEQTFRRAVALRPLYWATHTRLGTFLRNQGRYQQAAAEFERAIALTPDNAQAHMTLGGLDIYLGRYEPAIASFRRSVALGPTAQAYSNWGMTYFRMRRFEEAAATLETARQLEPANYRVLANVARTAYWRGRRAEASTVCATVIRLAAERLLVNARDTDAHLLTAECLAKGGEADGARRELRLSEVTFDTEPHAVLFVAMIENQLGARGTALEWLRHAVANGLPAAELRSWIEIDNLRGDPAFPAPADSR